MIPILGTFLTLFVGGHPVHFWVINSYNWQLFGNYHFSDQFVLKITPYKRDLGVKVDIFDPQLELKIHFWVINNWESISTSSPKETRILYLFANLRSEH